MKTFKTFLFTTFLLVSSVSVNASEKNYWQVIKQFMQDGTREARTKYREYIDTFTAEQLIIAGRQCSAEADRICPETVFCEGTNYLLAFFYLEYPKKGGLKNLDLVLKEIEDKGQTNFWRASLIDFLGHARRTKLLTVEQLCKTLGKMQKTLGDKGEHYWLRSEASQTIRHILSVMEKRNLLAEPIIKNKLKDGKKLTELRKAVAEGTIVLSDRYKAARIKTLQYYNEYAQRLLTILKESDRKAPLQSEAFSVLASLWSGKAITAKAQIAETLGSVIRDYEKHDESLWRIFLSVGFKDLQLHDAGEIGKRMVKDARHAMHRREIQTVIKKYRKQ